MVTFASLGFAQGGVDPYFSLFQGNGNTATFLGSNYNQAMLGTGGDFSLAFNLSAGAYMIAMGANANMSFAENNPALYSTLGAGFTGFGYDTGSNKPYYYDLSVTSNNTAVPEPATFLLLVAGLVFIAYTPFDACIN